VNDAHVIDRRFLLRLVGSLAAAAALGAGISLDGVQRLRHDSVASSQASSEPDSALWPPGMYEFHGTVRLQAPLVRIGGISNEHQISWTPGALRTPVANFTSIEQFEQPWHMPAIRVDGGQLAALRVIPLSFA
jgi:hypothetical protein